MDDLLNFLISGGGLETWLTDHGLGWLVSNQVIMVIGLFLNTVILYYLGWIVIRWGIRSALRSTAKQRSWPKTDTEKREKTLLQIVHSIWKVIAIGYLLAIVLKNVFNVDLSPIMTSAGILGVALGFGSQSLVKDFLTGLFIIAENQYRVGDVVEISGAGGKVERVGTRTTVLRDEDGNVHYIPNGSIQRVVNKTMGYSISRFDIQVDSSGNIDEITKVIDKIGEDLAQDEDWRKKIIKPLKFVSIAEISGKSTTLVIAGRTQPSDQWSVTSEMRRRLIDEFKEKNIALA